MKRNLSRPSNSMSAVSAKASDGIDRCESVRCSVREPMIRFRAFANTMQWRFCSA